MPKQTPLKRETLPYTLRVNALRVFLVLVVLFTSYLAFKPAPNRVQAATSATMNFQARLLTNSGSVVPDGNYHIEFKIFNALSSSGSSQGSCSGDANCVWVET